METRILDNTPFAVDPDRLTNPLRVKESDQILSLFRDPLKQTEMMTPCHSVSGIILTLYS